jgi:hypothetical protein
MLGMLENAVFCIGRSDLMATEAAMNIQLWTGTIGSDNPQKAEIVYLFVV